MSPLNFPLNFSRFYFMQPKTDEHARPPDLTHGADPKVSESKEPYERVPYKMVVCTGQKVQDQAVLISKQGIIPRLVAFRPEASRNNPVFIGVAVNQCGLISLRIEEENLVDCLQAETWFSSSFSGESGLFKSGYMFIDCACKHLNEHTPGLTANLYQPGPDTTDWLRHVVKGSGVPQVSSDFWSLVRLDRRPWSHGRSPGWGHCSFWFGPRCTLIYYKEHGRTTATKNYTTAYSEVTKKCKRKTADGPAWV